MWSRIFLRTCVMCWTRSKTKYCPSCLKQRRKEYDKQRRLRKYFFCKHCWNLLPEHKYSFCNNVCKKSYWDKNIVYIQKECKICKKEFLTTKNNKVVCSESCAKINKNFLMVNINRKRIWFSKVSLDSYLHYLSVKKSKLSKDSIDLLIN